MLKKYPRHSGIVESPIAGTKEGGVFVKQFKAHVAEVEKLAKEGNCGTWRDSGKKASRTF